MHVQLRTARDRLIGTAVVIKQLDAPFEPPNGDENEDRAARSAFREFKQLRTIKHGNV